MNESGAVRRLEAGGGLESEVERFPERVPAARVQGIRQRLPVELLQDGIRRSVLHLAHREHGGDVRMLDLRRKPELLPPRPPVSEGGGLQNEQRDLAPVRILRLVEETVGGRAQRFANAQAAGEGLPGWESVSGATLIEHGQGMGAGRLEAAEAGCTIRVSTRSVSMRVLRKVWQQPRSANRLESVQQAGLLQQPTAGFLANLPAGDPRHGRAPHPITNDEAAREPCCVSDRMDNDLSATELPLIRSVLVVDDAGVVRRLSFRVLSESGYRVFEAASAIEALEVLAMLRGHVDLVLVDVVMPEVNGVDLVRLIRERWAEPAILFMSAYPAEVLAREGLKDLRVQFLAKPFTRDELLAGVQRAIAAPRQVDAAHRKPS